MSARTTFPASWLAAVWLVAALACGKDEAAPPEGAAGAAPTPAPSRAADGQRDAAEPPAPPAAAALLPDQVATIDGELALTWAELDRYLGTVFARLPEGEDALQQLVMEAVIDATAAQAGLTAGEEEIAALEARLEARAREASGGQFGLQESLGPNVTAQDLSSALRLQVLQEQIVRQEQGLPADAPVDPPLLQAWIDE
ncbi:MAG TPA: hypothetical protein VFD43_10235, partial [Planctomycetota bacterium]|nr:hypothetical protein [Planctomycetota bacterium]